VLPNNLSYEGKDNCLRSHNQEKTLKISGTTDAVNWIHKLNM